MRADNVEVSWDAAKAKWLIRIQAGEEVLRRHCDLPQDWRGDHRPEISSGLMARGLIRS
jgi:hypothetical protein